MHKLAVLRDAYNSLTGNNMRIGVCSKYVEVRDPQDRELLVDEAYDTEEQAEEIILGQLKKAIEARCEELCSGRTDEDRQLKAVNE